MLTGFLKDGTDYLSASTVRRVVQVAGMSIVGSTMAVSRLDREVRRITTTYPDEDPAELADSMVRMCEEEVLDWMRTRTVHPCSNADLDPAGGPTGQKLVEDLEKTIPKEDATQDPPPGSKEDAWMMEVLRQATKVLCLAEKACDTAMKGNWQPCAYHGYRRQMDQEVGHLYALFGGPDVDEVRVKGRRRTRLGWPRHTKALKGRESSGACNCGGHPNSTWCDIVSTTGHPRRAGHARSRSGQPSRGPTRCGKAVPGAFVDFVTYPPERQTGQPGAWCQ